MVANIYNVWVGKQATHCLEPERASVGAQAVSAQSYEQVEQRGGWRECQWISCCDVYRYARGNVADNRRQQFLVSQNYCCMPSGFLASFLFQPLRNELGLNVVRLRANVGYVLGFADVVVETVIG